MAIKTLIGNIKFKTQREGKAVEVKRGEAFDFTKEELADLDRMAAQFGTEMYRDPVNETSEDGKPASKTANKGGKKAADDNL